jgi:hypothetical protein
VPDKHGLVIYPTSIPFLFWRKIMSFDKAMEIASRDERFMATVYAMNSLLIHKGIYTTEEFQQLFSEWVGKELKKNAHDEQHSKARFCEA